MIDEIVDELAKPTVDGCVGALKRLTSCILLRDARILVLSEEITFVRREL